MSQLDVEARVVLKCRHCHESTIVRSKLVPGRQYFCPKCGGRNRFTELDLSELDKKFTALQRRIQEADTTLQQLIADTIKQEEVR